MTLVVLPEGVQKSGSGSGIVWSHNRYGAYTRNRSMPVNPNTPRQALLRSIVAGITIAWQNILTQVQRDAWEVYASNVPWLNKLGQTVYLTGFNHFLRSNVPRLQGAPIVPALVRVDVAPTIFNLATPEQSLAVAASAGGQTISVTFDDTATWVAEVGAAEMIYMGMPQNASINFFGGPYRFASLLVGGGAPVSPEVMAVPFPIALGQKVWIRTRIFRADARLSDFSFAQTIVAA